MKSATANKLRFTDILPGVLRLIPRIPSIAFHLRKGLGIKNEDTLSLGAVLEENAKRFPDRPALFFEDQRYTHAGFNAVINQYAHYFLAQGVQPGETVVVFVENRPELLFFIASLAKIGAVASLVNPNQRGAALKHSIEIDRGNHFLIGEEVLDAFETVRPELHLGASTTRYWVRDRNEADCPAGYIDLRAAIGKRPTHNPDTTAMVRAGQRYANVFTSGTTGLPKASIQTHRKWLVTYRWFGKINLNLRSDDVVYVPIPFFHTNALIVAWPTAAGAAIAMRRKFSTSNFWPDVQRYNVSSFIYIGEVCRYLLNAPPSELEKQHRIRKIFGNGLRPDIWQAFKKRFHIPEIFEFYGAADGNISFTNTLNIDRCVGWSPGQYAIIKYDIENNEPYRNAAGFFEKAAPGEAGLLIAAISKKLPFDGYVNQADNTAKIFENVFAPGDRWFNTGDLMRDIGFRHAQFVDRLGDTFRWKGENVATAEVEGVISKLDGITNCTVYGVQLPHADGRAGMAALTCETHHTDFDFDGLTAALRHELPAYAVPLFVRFCDELETTATHKIKKYRLKQEGFDTADPVYVMLPGAKWYVRLEGAVLAGVRNGAYKF